MKNFIENDGQADPMVKSRLRTWFSVNTFNCGHDIVIITNREVNSILTTNDHIKLF